jgi:thiamine biosynthesis protein ThiS
VKLLVNGEEREIATGTTLAALLEMLELSAKRVAVERNRDIVKQELWNELVLEDGDELEIVHFVGGG